MEISRTRTMINSKSTINKEVKLEEKRNFSQSFNQARDKKSEEELKGLIEKIKKGGNKLIITKSYVDVKAYKRLIKEYLDNILPYIYNTKKDISFWQTQYFITVDTIDKKLENLTEVMLNEEKEVLDVAKTIDEIQGLILDIYK
ncbi:YaaR family protein [Clostridium sp.]|uniref:YaaR family protein n=1 Tax=Clostridium sp. TaxID=1506 RepID=UPI003992BD76